MARGINKVILVGNLGADPDTRYTAGGSAVTKIRIATTRQWKDKQTGERQERTDWHRITFFGRLAEISAEYLRKGSQVYVEGRLETSSYEKEGQTHYSTDVIANEMQMLGGRQGQGGGDFSSGASPRPAQQPAAKSGAVAEDFDDDIPF